MSDFQNSDQGFNNLNDDRLFNMLSQLKVPPSSMDRDAAWDRLMLGVKREQRMERIWGGITRWGAVAFVLIIASSIIIDWQFSTKKYNVPHGKLAYLTLPDSSRITLNAGTQIKRKEYGFTQKREVVLNGEALFDVKSGPIDFVVKVGEHRVKVLGTRFNVFYRNEILEVKCISGEVEVSVNNVGTQLLKAGRGLYYLPELTTFREARFETTRSTLWTQGEFYFSQTSLNLVFEELERQFNIVIQVEGFNPQERIYTGYFTKDGYLNALDLVCLPMGLSYDIDRNAGVVRISPVNR